MENLIIIAVVSAIVAAAVIYIVKAKKRGNKCIGCPHANTCQKARDGRCNTQK